MEIEPTPSHAVPSKSLPHPPASPAAPSRLNLTNHPVPPETTLVGGPANPSPTYVDPVLTLLSPETQSPLPSPIHSTYSSLQFHHFPDGDLIDDNAYLSDGSEPDWDALTAEIHLNSESLTRHNPDGTVCTVPSVQFAPVSPTPPPHVGGPIPSSPQPRPNFGILHGKPVELPSYASLPPAVVASTKSDPPGPIRCDTRDLLNSTLISDVYKLALTDLLSPDSVPIAPIDSSINQPSANASVAPQNVASPRSPSYIPPSNNMDMLQTTRRNSVPLNTFAPRNDSSSAYRPLDRSDTSGSSTQTTSCVTSATTTRSVVTTHNSSDSSSPSDHHPPARPQRKSSATTQSLTSSNGTTASSRVTAYLDGVVHVPSDGQHVRVMPVANVAVIPLYLQPISPAPPPVPQILPRHTVTFENITEKPPASLSTHHSTVEPVSNLLRFRRPSLYSPPQLGTCRSASAPTDGTSYMLPQPLPSCVLPRNQTVETKGYPKAVPRPPKLRPTRLATSADKKEMFSDHYCCFAIPLYNVGIYVILAQFAAFGLVSGILGFSAPSVLAIAVPDTVTAIFGVLCILIGLVQAMG